ncbi:MAG: hypothetical protein ABSF26_01125 [Thermoguttaceae bacterium]|jgi:hypothetical protein
MVEHDIMKALEVWTLQTLLNVSILLGILAAGLALIQGYYRALEKQLTLRVSIEIWRVFTVLVVDMLLTIVVLIGLLVLNPDIMSDIKMAVPFCPAATVLFAVALCLRLFHGGHETGSRNYYRALWLLGAANLVNLAGFTFVMEAASEEYLAGHPMSYDFWMYLRTHLRSNADPCGLEVAQYTFYVCFPLLLAVLAWGGCSALRQIRAGWHESGK